jgi:hypothetical protein
VRGRRKSRAGRRGTSSVPTTVARFPGPSAEAGGAAGSWKVRAWERNSGAVAHSAYNPGLSPKEQMD